MHFERQRVVFEVYNPFSILQLSEILTDFRITVGERTIYSGRSVVSHLVHTGIMLMVEATLADPWEDLDVLAALAQKGLLRDEVHRFVTSWRAEYNILPEFKILVSDFRSFLSDLSVWLKQVDLGASQEVPEETDRIISELVEDAASPVRPLTANLFDRLQSVTEAVPSDDVANHKTFLRRALHPLILCSPFVHRCYTKPLGYAGDFGMVNMILSDPRRGDSLFAKIINSLILEGDGAQAHRNRIRILTEILNREACRMHSTSRPFRVLNIGCGPAQEVRDFVVSSDQADRCEITLMDFSPEALSFARTESEQCKQAHGSHIVLQFVEKSIDALLRESVTRDHESGDTPPKYDLVYCAGLFDYFVDSVCQRLITLFFDWLLPGGLLVITNIHPKNPQRAMMEYLLEWNVVHRDEEHLAGLARMPGPKTVFSDDTGVNIFLTVRKDVC